MLAGIYLEPGDEVLFSEHAFLVYKIAALSNSATPVVVPEPDLKVDVDRMLAGGHAQEPAWFTSPIPTIRPAPTCHMTRCAACMRGPAAQVLLVLDAAYAEYVRRNDYEAGIELVATTDNTVMTRTFSKIYGLA